MANQYQSNATYEATLAWLLKFHSIGDSFSVQRMPEVYAKDAVLQFCNQEEKRGLESILEFFERQFKILGSMKHDIQHFDVVGDVVYQAVTITYTVKGDPQKSAIKVAGFAVFHRVPEGEEEAGKLRRFDVYLDPTPLGQKIQEVGAKE